MNQTVSSEFERARQRILAEIEARARKRGGGLTLQDWLKAAEEVMPDEKTARVEEMDDGDTIVSLSSRARTTQNETRQSGSEKNMNERAVSAQISPKTRFFGYFIGAVVTLMLLGAGSLAYVHLNKRLDQVQQSTQQLQKSVAALQQRLDDPVVLDDQSISQLMHRIERLEVALSADGASATQPAVTDTVRAELNAANVVTEAVLDAKLEQFSQRLEQAIDKRFATILAQLKHIGSRQQGVGEDQATESSEAAPAEQKTDDEIVVPEPQAPVAPKVPKTTTPSVKTDAGTASAGRGEDERWLAGLDSQGWVLQLASVLDRASLEQLKRSKGLDDARIVRQLRGGRTFYVLVLGGFADRASARKAAGEIRESTGISPWIRPVRDLQARLPR